MQAMSAGHWPKIYISGSLILIVTHSAVPSSDHCTPNLSVCISHWVLVAQHAVCGLLRMHAYA